MNTSDKSELRVGMQIKDNDPRMAGRVLSIFDVQDSYVWTRSTRGSGVYRVLRRRIYTDGKPRRSGFDLLTEAA